MKRGIDRPAYHKEIVPEKLLLSGKMSVNVIDANSHYQGKLPVLFFDFFDPCRRVVIPFGNMRHFQPLFEHWQIGNPHFSKMGHIFPSPVLLYGWLALQLISAKGTFAVLDVSAPAGRREKNQQALVRPADAFAIHGSLRLS